MVSPRVQYWCNNLFVSDLDEGVDASSASSLTGWKEGLVPQLCCATLQKDFNRLKRCAERNCLKFMCPILGSSGQERHVAPGACVTEGSIVRGWSIPIRQKG